MKKQLLATTALVAGGLMAGAAQAADPIKLSLGGYAYTGLTVASQDNTAASNGTINGQNDWFVQNNGHQITTDIGVSDVFWEGEVFFVGETTLDNGIKVGVNIQLEAYTSNDQVDEHYIYFTGGFGRLVIGAENSAPYIMHYSAPSVGSGFGLESPTFVPFRPPTANAVGNSSFTPLSLTSDANKITYYTPRFAPGFQFGISYTPDDDSQGGAQGTANRGCRGGCAFDAGNGINDNDQEGSLTTGSFHHFVEVGMNFVRSINGVDLAFDLGYGTGFIEKQMRSVAGVAGGALTDESAGFVIGGDKLYKQKHEVQAGFNVGYAGFTFGGAFHWDNQGLQGANNRYDFVAGIMYGAGPWLVAANGAYSIVQDGRRQTTTAAGSYANRSNDTLVSGLVEGAYILGPGVRVYAVGQYSKWEGNGTDSEEADGFGFSTGVRLNF